MQTVEGEWINTTDGVQQEFFDLYGSLFRSSMSCRVPVKSSIIERGVRLSTNHISNLEYNFSMDDNKVVLNSTPNNKTPGLDGFNSMFFKASWNIIKEDLYTAICDFFQTGKLLKEINVTSITLVPKVSVPFSVGDF